jgi:sugar lactone lactonase YvrE
MFFIDTAACRVDVFDYDIETGKAEGRRPAFNVEGMPDGMTIDDEGMLWVAIWGGGTVRRYDPKTGLILAEVEVPSRNTTSCCFGGEDMRTLYVTTSAEEEQENPMAGCVFSARLPVAGAPTQRFREEN